MIHKFYHQFKCGKVHNVTIDLTNDIPVCYSSFNGVGEPSDVMEEHTQWQNYITPFITELLNAAQSKHISEYGFKPNNPFLLE